MHKCGWYLFAILFVTSHSYADLGLQELSCDRVVCAAVNQKTAFINALKLPSSKYYLFNLDTQSFVALEDGRLPFMSSHILRWRDGFVLVSRPIGREGSFTFLGQDGKYISSKRFSEINGMQELTFTFFTLDAQSRILASYQEEKDGDVSCLGEVRLEQNTFIPNLARFKCKPTEISVLWVADNQGMYMISPFSGRVNQVGKNFLPTKLVKKGAELIVNKSGSMLGFSLPGSSTYKRQLNRVECHGDLISFIEMTFTGEKEKRIFMGREVEADLNIPQTFLLSGHDLKKFPYVLVAKWGQRILSFDEDEGLFQLSTLPLAK